MPLFSRGPSGGRKRKPTAGPWMPKERGSWPSGEELQRLEADDLKELLAATNAKRAARGKNHLTESEVHAQNEEISRQMRPGSEKGSAADRWAALDD